LKWPEAVEWTRRLEGLTSGRRDGDRRHFPRLMAAAIGRQEIATWAATNNIPRPEDSH
jgi:hypothetical protein